MGFLYILESIRNPFLDTVMMLITRLGEETAFLAVALVFFLVFSKLFPPKVRTTELAPEED